MSEFAQIFESSVTTAFFVCGSLMFLAILTAAALHVSGARIVSRSFVLRAAAAAVALCVGATAIHAWQAQTGGAEDRAATKATTVEGNMGAFIKGLHASPFIHRLPVQAIEDYN
jgi:hypothetical protein